MIALIVAAVVLVVGAYVVDHATTQWHRRRLARYGRITRAKNLGIFTDREALVLRQAVAATPRPWYVRLHEAVTR